MARLRRAWTAGTGWKGRQLGGVSEVSAAEFLGFGSAQFAVGGLAQEFQFVGIEFAQVTGFLIENQGAVTYAANLLDKVADLLKHLAQFAVAALDKHHFVPGIVSLADLADAGRRGAHRGRARTSAFDGDAAA